MAYWSKPTRDCSLPQRGWVLVMADRDEALGAWENLRAHAHRRGSLFGFLGANLWSGAASLWRGELPEAENRLLAALEDARAWGLLRSGGFYGPAFGFTGAVRILRGDLEGAREQLDPAGGDERLAHGSRLTLASRVELLLAEGRHEEALAAADELAERCGPIVNPGWAPWRSLKARALDGLGRSDESVALAARSWRTPSHSARRASPAGQSECWARWSASGASSDCARRPSCSSVDRQARAGDRVVHPRRCVRRQRRPTEARGLLRRALELADRCDAAPLAEQARSELYAAGGRPRRTALSGLESLTASERRVADLAAEGRTNKQIAQALYVTPKTVELHLSNTYRKLDIGSRRELGKALAD